MMTYEQAVARAFLKALWHLHRTRTHPFQYRDLPTRAYAIRRLRVMAGVGP